MDAILSDLRLLEDADQLCIRAAKSLISNTWLVKQIDCGSFDLDKYREYNARMGGARLEPLERCKALEEGLSRLSKTSRDMLDDGSTVAEIYSHLQTELYKQVWRYHLCMCEDGAKPYFDRLAEDEAINKKQQRREDGARPYFDRLAEDEVINKKQQQCLRSIKTTSLVSDLEAIGKLKAFTISSSGFPLHDASKPFTSHGQLVHTFRNVFDSFDSSSVSRAFSVPQEVCVEFQAQLSQKRGEHNLLLAGILDELTVGAAAALRCGTSFAEVEETWHAEIERRNVGLMHNAV